MVRKHTYLTTFLIKKPTKYLWYNGDMTKPFNKKLMQLADLFNDYHTPLLVPTRLEDNNPISLPPSKMDDLTKPQDPQETINERLEELQKLSHESPHLQQATTEQLTKEKVEKIQMEELQKLSHVVEQPPKRGRGRPKGSKNKRTIEKLSRDTPHQPLSVNLSMTSFTSVRGKTSLSYALLYASQLTPIQISLLLENADTLELTMAEVLALSLLDRTKNHDQKAEKIYWDLMKNQAKNEKTTPVKQENTLLDEALSKAENAIFGEVVDNPEKA